MAPLARNLRYAYDLGRLHLRRRPLRYLFILGTMRSGSTLLVHLLNSHPDISGFGEAHTSYRRRRDLWKFYVRLKLSLGERTYGERYAMDKILHDRYEIAPEYLRSPRFRYLFLLREPASTLDSMVRHFRKQEPALSLRDHLDYFVARLATLERLAHEIGDRERMFFFTYEEMLERTAEVFGALERWLELRSPLREDYAETPLTGVPVFGDHTGKIREGRIVRGGDDSGTKPELPAEILGPAEEAFRRACATLRELCTCAASDTGAA